MMRRYAHRHKERHRAPRGFNSGRVLEAKTFGIDFRHREFINFARIRYRHPGCSRIKHEGGGHASRVRSESAPGFAGRTEARQLMRFCTPINVREYELEIDALGARRRENHSCSALKSACVNINGKLHRWTRGSVKRRRFCPICVREQCLEINLLGA